MVDVFDSQAEAEEPEADWKIRAVWISICVVLLGFGAWVVKTRIGHPEANKAIMAALTQELDTDRQALQFQHNKVLELTERIDTYRSAIERRQVQDLKKAVDDHNQLAREQQVERQKYADMATKYNAKVAKLRQLEKD